MTFKEAGIVLLLIGSAVSAAAEPAPPARKAELGVRKLSIAPSSASLAGGRARLILTELIRKPGVLVGDYELKVTPYFFKSEKGKILFAVSDEALLKLAQKAPTEFAGKATTARGGKSRPTHAKAIPTSKDRGSLKISVTTENGMMVFNTSYRFAE